MRESLNKQNLVKIEISARHIHLTKNDLECLFGKNYKLTRQKQLSQPNGFSAEETVTTKIGETEFNNVRIVGPIRDYTQFEISTTDSFKAKIKPPLRSSGDLMDTPGFTLIGPKGKIELTNGTVIPQRHLHISNQQARKLNLKTGVSIKIKITGPRGGKLENVYVKTAPDYALAVHLDTDEGNAFGIDSKNNLGNLII